MSVMDRNSPSPSSCSEPNSTGMPSLDAPNYSEQTRNVLKSVIRSRKSWKSCRDGEVVWPLELEAALLEGLENYVPEDTRETRILGRFPMRNRFLSDYIYQKTGKKRTAKQVGSRIQQLRDSCAGERLLALLHPYPPRQGSPRRSTSPSSGRRGSPKPVPSWRGTDNPSRSSLSRSSTMLSETDANYESQFLDEKGGDTNPVNVVYIDLLPTDSATSSETCPSGKWHNELPSHYMNHVDRVNHIQISQQPRHLRHIDPTVTLVSQSDITAHSVFTVRENGATVFSETVALTPAGPLFGGRDTIDSPQLYHTALVPGYWEQISCCTDPTQFTIEQRVFQDRPSTSAPLFSAIYRFRFVQHSQTTHTAQTHLDYVRVPDINGMSTTTRDQLFPDVAEPYQVFDMEALKPFMDFEGENILVEIEALDMQPSPSWAASSPGAQSSSSMLSASAGPSRHNSMSPAGSCMSEMSPSCRSHMPSPILYPAAVASVSSQTLGQHVGHFVRTPKSEPYLGSDYPQDLFDNMNILVGNAYGIQS